MHFRRLERYWEKMPPEHVIGRTTITIKERAEEGVPMTRIGGDLRSDADKKIAADHAKKMRARAPKIDLEKQNFGAFVDAIRKRGGSFGFDDLRQVG